MNLMRDWLWSFFPHCFGKINRVSYGYDFSPLSPLLVTNILLLFRQFAEEDRPGPLG